MVGSLPGSPWAEIRVSVGQDHHLHLEPRVQVQWLLVECPPTCTTPEVTWKASAGGSQGKLEQGVYFLRPVRVCL